MVYRLDTIRFGAAQRIFPNLDIAAHGKNGDRLGVAETAAIASYSALHPRGEGRISDTGLTDLCIRLVQLLTAGDSHGL